MNDRSMSDDLQTQVPVKRASCDRCRAQKLRCIRIPDRPTDCVRCNRSQLECVTSSSRRPGRPKNSTTTTTTTTISRQHQMSAAGRKSLEQQPPADQPPLDIHLPTHVEGWFNFGLLGPDEDMMSGSWNSVDSGFPISGAAPLPTSSRSSLAHSPDQTAHMSGISLAKGSLNTMFEQDNNGMRHLPSHHPSVPVLDPGVHLSSLHCDLSRQLFTLKSMPVDMTKAMRLTSMHDANGNSSHCSEADLETNPLAKITTTSAYFAKLLCSFQIPTTCDGNDAPKDSSAQPLSIADLLTILSCHMLTISIYDSLFSHFTHQTVHNPEEVNNLMQSAPTIFLGGIPIPPRPDMLNHFLYWLVDSQLRPIEELLNLPDEFCISLKNDGTSKDKSNQLFSDQRGQSLYSTLMKMEMESASDGRGCLGAIHSLKQKIKHVQGRE